MANNVNNVSFTYVKQQCNNVGDSKHREVEATADKLVKLYASPKSRNFYILAAYKLSEAQIWRSVEKAAKKRNPAAYFNWLCKQLMQAPSSLGA